MLTCWALASAAGCATVKVRAVCDFFTCTTSMYVLYTACIEPAHVWTKLRTSGRKLPFALISTRCFLRSDACGKAALLSRSECCHFRVTTDRLLRFSWLRLGRHLELAQAGGGAHGHRLVDAGHGDAVARLAHVQQRVEGEHADRVRRLTLRDGVRVLLRCIDASSVRCCCWPLEQAVWCLQQRSYLHYAYHTRKHMGYTCQGVVVERKHQTCILMSCLFWNQQRLCSSFMVQLLLHWSQRCGSSSRPHAAGTSFSVPHDSQPNIATLRATTGTHHRQN